jgi:hypothetical protein
MTQQVQQPERLPAISWEQLEAVMVDLADTEAKRLMVRHLVEGTRKQAAFLPVEETIREILCIGFALMDGDFQPQEPTARLPA